MTYQEHMWETEVTRRGHWHPLEIPCSERCPMGDPLTRDVFRREIDRAMRPLLRHEAMIHGRA